MLPLGLVRQPHRRTVLDLRPVAVGREQRELCPGAVLKIKGYLDEASKAQAEVSELKREIFRLQQRLDNRK